MSRDEAIEKAREVTVEEGWPWIEPVEAAKRREFPWLWPNTWRVETNCQAKIRSVRVYIDDVTKQVKRIGFVAY